MSQEPPIAKKKKSGPSPYPLTAMYDSNTTTGQRRSAVLPIKISTPCRKGSVLEALRCSFTIPGLDLLSTNMSLSLKWVDASLPGSDGTVNSPALIKPKKQIHDAAHSMIQSLSDGCESHTFRSFSRIVGVIWRRGFSWEPCLACSDFNTMQNMLKSCHVAQTGIR